MMKKPESYEEVSSLLTRQLRPGVAANGAVTREALQEELAGGTLRLLEFDGGLLVCRLRDGFQRLWFYLQREGTFPPLPDTLPTVTEIPMRPRDTRLQETVSMLKAQGFEALFTRVRLSRPPEAAFFLRKSPVRRAAAEDLDQVQEILAACFDPRTACLPQREELSRDLEAGSVLLFPETGVLRLKAGKAGTELRHLAVLPEKRGTGAARALAEAYLSQWGHLRSHLWVRSDYAAPLHLYESLGYRSDSWTSQVLWKP